MEVIEVKESWDKTLEDIISYDFYHTYDYHHISKSENEKPILLVYSEEDKIIAIPFLLRQVFDSDYRDLTSVYGYSGPLVKNIDETFDNSNFKKELNAFFEMYQVVSVFSRLHPFLNKQGFVINNLGKIKKLGKVVNIDLSKTLDEQRSQFSKTTKRYLNKTRKICLVKNEVNSKMIDVFMDLYYENMDRVNAKQSYYFSKEYFEAFANSKNFKTDILYLVLEETNEIISAAMMIKTNNIVQYHISGTRNKHLDLTPIRVLIDEMRITATEQGYEYFNLGGGLGSLEDSLFNFKASFSKDFKDFKIWKYVVNQSSYDNLVKQYSDLNGNQEFFPLYRNS